MCECQSPNHPWDREPEDLQQILWRFGGWGNAHRGYGMTPIWYCAKCRRANIGRWKFYNDKRVVRRLQRKAVKAGENDEQPSGTNQARLESR